MILNRATRLARLSASEHITITTCHVATQQGSLGWSESRPGGLEAFMFSTLGCKVAVLGRSVWEVSMLRAAGCGLQAFHMLRAPQDDREHTLS